MAQNNGDSSTESNNTDTEQRRKKRESLRVWRAANPTKGAEASRKWRANNPGVHTAQRKASDKRILDAAYMAYGDKCACCGEMNRIFLQLHHLDKGGKEHRNVRGEGGVHMARKLKAEGYPPIMAILCANCHQAVSRLGHCPHNPEKTW